MQLVNDALNYISDEDVEQSKLRKDVLAFVERLKKADPQFSLYGAQNIWIVKPACKQLLFFFSIKF
jgi:hypothetical protein